MAEASVRTRKHISGPTRELPSIRQKYHSWYDARRGMHRLRLLSGDSADILDVIDMVEVLLVKYETDYTISNVNSWLLEFPNLFMEPQVGDKLFNRTKNEFYTVAHVGKDPHYDIWDHTVRLAGTTAPGKTDDIIMMDESNLVRFTWGFPQVEAKRMQGTVAEIDHKEAKAFRPTVTARVTRSEPGTIGRVPFGDAKVLKPQLFDTVRSEDDPLRYSVQIFRQPFDNLLQFDCWERNTRTATRLALWLQNFFLKYVPILKGQGVEEMLMWDMRDSLSVEKWRDDIIHMSLRMYFRTGTLTAKENVPNLRRLRLVTRVAKHSKGILGGTTGENDAWRDRLWFGRVHNTSGDYLYGTFEYQDMGWDEPSQHPSYGSPFDDVTGQFDNSY